MSAAPQSRAARLDWLRLARTPQVGPVTFAELLRRYQDPASALAALPMLSRRGGRAQPLKPPTRETAEAELSRIEAAGARLLLSADEDFPPLLKALDPPPPVLTVFGATHLLSEPAVAMVGSRKASAIAMRFAQDIARTVAGAGFVIVSGLARGLDAAAHEGAFLGEGKTVAVVAGGADVVYPPENHALQERIAREGAVLSERPLGARPRAEDFPRRNRLISGLSLGVVVIEAAERSGSLITARYAAEQGREVMAAPGSPLDPRAKGANRLIRDGAALIENAEDVLEILRGLRRPTAYEPSDPPFADPPRDEETAMRAADDVRERVAELLSPSPVGRDEIVRFAGADPGAVAAALIELELAGRALQHPGGYVSSAPSARSEEGDAA